MFLAEWLFCSAERRAPRSHSFSGPCVAPLGPARAPPPVPGARALKPPKPSFRPSRRPAPSPWGLGAPTSPSERPSEAREPPISPGGPPAAPPAGPFNGHIKRAVGVGSGAPAPLAAWVGRGRPGAGWGGLNFADVPEVGHLNAGRTGTGTHCGAIDHIALHGTTATRVRGRARPPVGRVRRRLAHSGRRRRSAWANILCRR